VAGFHAECFAPAASRRFPRKGDIELTAEPRPIAVAGMRQTRSTGGGVALDDTGDLFESLLEPNDFRDAHAPPKQAWLSKNARHRLRGPASGQGYCISERFVRAASLRPSFATARL